MEVQPHKLLRKVREILDKPLENVTEADYSYVVGIVDTLIEIYKPEEIEPEDTGIMGLFKPRRRE